MTWLSTILALYLREKKSYLKLNLRKTRLIVMLNFVSRYRSANRMYLTIN